MATAVRASISTPVFPVSLQVAVISTAGRIKVAEFEPVQKEAVNITSQESMQLDFDLQSRSASFDELTTSELLLALPGTDKWKITVARCSNCHNLQFALQRRRDRADWLQTIEKMRGFTNSGLTRSEEEVREILRETHDLNHELADYLTLVRGPDSPDLPHQLFPRPAEDASTGLVVTEYQIPRGADSVIIRGDQRGAWPHDVMPEPSGRYVWYTDHFTNVLGRLEPESGEIKEFPYPHAVPEKKQGAHKLLIDKDGNIWFGEGWQGAIGKFDPRTEQFTQWTDSDSGHAMFGFGNTPPASGTP